MIKKHISATLQMVGGMDFMIGAAGIILTWNIEWEIADIWIMIIEIAVGCITTVDAAGNIFIDEKPSNFPR